MARSFKVCEFLSRAAPAGRIATAELLLVGFGLEVFGCLRRGEEWAYEHWGIGGEGTGGGARYGEAVVA